MIQNTYECPRCGGYALRIRRRRVDRLISIFKPVQRYKCQQYNCSWQGNIGVSDDRLLTSRNVYRKNYNL